MYNNFSELIRKISPTNMFFSIDRPSYQKILVLIGSAAEEILMRP